MAPAAERTRQSAEERRAAAPAISLPKGGGAIRGIGEKFAANPVTGTGSISVPLATSPGRSGFGPQLSLSYDSGSGNGPFGFGWSLSIPAITRKTDKGLPQYRDAEESDVYILSGAEDLVPFLNPDGTRFEDDTTAPGYVIHRYRPRVEGLFARIERWTNNATGEIHWRSITRDNVTTLYGKDNQSRVVDPADPSADNPTGIFRWLICESYDDKGNAIVYEYAAENDENVDRGQANERNRVRTANRYLKRIKYGNRVSRLIQPDLSLASWMFEVVFDYDEGHYEELDLDPARPEAEQHRFGRASALPDLPWDAQTRGWAVRPDPFSSYRSGFELRTYRRCRRVLMFHHIPDLPTGDNGYDGLVRSTEFDYADLDNHQPVTVEDELAHQGSTRFASFLRRVTQSGFVRDDDQAVVVRNGTPYPTYLKKSLPPLEFEYSKAAIQDDVLEFDAETLENLPAGLDGATYLWVDLHGEGIPGILTEQADAWLYKRNLSPLPVPEDGSASVKARLTPVERVASKPNLAVAGGQTQFMDLAGDGQPDLVALDGPTPGLYEHDGQEGWQPFRPFTSRLNRDTRDPNLKFVDLDGDGHADVLITDDHAFVWHPSLAEAGFGPARRVTQALDEEKGPRLVFADGTQSIYLADMCGDGLTALVRIRNGEVCYWPNLGYGRFGAKVTMDNAPWFDHPDQFDQRRLRLADIDGSGTNDVIYLAHDGVRLYFNQLGNRFSEARRLAQFPLIDNVSSVMTADLLGNGTACLVWSSPLPADARRPMRYLDLMGGIKPHLLIKSVNNLGAETMVHYAPSTKFYLADKLAGKPWITKVPFPVHVVERVETDDRISGNRFVTRYAYHHGYFDGIEREFRGFGMVEQFDTEALAALSAGGQLPVGTNVEEASHVPPVLTKTWFHTGVYVGRNHVSNFFAGLLDTSDKGEYYREPGLTDAQSRDLLLDDTVLPAGLTVQEEREACRALKGSMLRQEVYALDGTDKQPHPYIVTEQNFTIRRAQPRGENRHAVFFSHARESINYRYERNPTDPRVSHTVTLDVDEFGNVLKSAAIGYGRRQPDLSLAADDQAKQSQTLVTYTENRVTNAIDTVSDYRTPLPCQTRTYELTGYLPSGPAERFRLSDFVQQTPAGVSHIFDSELSYEQDTSAGRQRRLIEHLRTLYRPDDLGVSLNDPLALLPLGQLESLALTGESYELAFTPGLFAQIYRRPLDLVRPPGAPPPENLLPDPAVVLPIDTVAGQAADRGGYVDLDGDGHWWVPSGRIFHSPDAADTATEERTHARQHFFLAKRIRDPFHTSATSTETVVTYDAYDLLVVETRDALDNRVTAGERDTAGDFVLPGNDYRVLQPRLTMDPNRNRAAVAFDALGMVVGTAVMGKPEENLGDALTGFVPSLTDAAISDHIGDPLTDPHAILDRATTRLVYDLHAYRRTKDQPDPQPTVIYAIARETHDADLSPGQQTKVQHSFSYSDGFGREIQKKIQAEPGPVPQRDENGNIIVAADGQPEMTPNDFTPRWVGSGWTVFNNKGNPVRQYEPFFTDTHRFEFDVRVGVSPVLFYDPLERVVATLHPNHTWEKVVVGPWRQETWDVNDTVLVVDPKNDNDVGAFFQRLPDADYLPTWHEQRHSGVLGAQEQAAANKAAIHADTPTIAHRDSLGRTFLMFAHNKFKHSNSPPAAPPTEEFYATRIVFDIESNQREVIDAVDRVVMRYHYDMLGNRIHQASMEAGERWMLNDAVRSPFYSWDSRDRRFRTSYDRLRRPTDSLLRDGANAESVVGRNTYGESRLNPEASNLRGKVVELRDQAGVVISDAYDFKGNPLHSQRQLAQSYKATLDWSAAVPLEPESYNSRTVYDAFNRPTQLIAPRSDQPGATVNVIQPIYNEANLLDQINVWLNRDVEPTEVLDPATANLHAVMNINYDARGQRTRIDFGNGVTTRYEYDPLTLRLTHLLTRRDNSAFPDDCPQPPPSGWPGCQIQNLHYTYDPAGNITHIRDDAQQTIYFRNRRVEPSADYTYDAIYRLIEATGREHLGQTGGAPNAPTPHSYNDAPRVGLLHPGDGNAMGSYLERYVYDAVGNFLEMQHRGSNPAHPGWTRTYDYSETSQLEASGSSNRLTGTTIGGTTETYSTAGDGYDAHGNMLRMPHLQVMQWNFRDELQMTQRQAVNPGDTDGVQHEGERTWYVYDSGGQRVRKVTESSLGQIKDERIYLGGFEIYRRHGANPLVRETLHIGDDQRRIVLAETRTQGDEPGVPGQLIRYQLSNHLGSVSLELDDRAQIISYEEYTPYGGVAYQSVRSQTETPKRYRFTDQERDDQSGFYYHGARYYASWLGRWASCDPEISANLYVYSAGSPTTLIDPNGRAPVESPIVGPYKTGPNAVGGDHIRQVASQTAGAGAKRTTAPQLNQALSVSTKTANYLDKLGQKIEAAINRAAWGKDYSKKPAGPTGTVTLKSTGTSGVGKTSPATPSTWFEDVKSFYKLREAGVQRDKALELVNDSGKQLDAAGTTPTRVPQPPNRAPKALKTGQTLSVETKTVTKSAATEPAVSAPGGGKVGWASKVKGGFGAALGVLGSFTGGYQVGTGAVQMSEGQTGEGATTMAEGGANLGLTIGTATAVKAKLVVAEKGIVAGGLTFLAGIAAAAAVGVAAEESRRAMRGEETMASEAVDYWEDVQQRAVSEEPSVGGALKYVGAEMAGGVSGFIAHGQESLWGLLD